MQMNLPLVGRREQVALVDRAAAQVRAGQARLVVFSGEIGVGKTRLLEFCAARYTDLRVLRGDCVELGAEGLPLAPVTSVLRDLLQQVSRDQLAALLPEAQLLLGLLPELRPATAGPGEQARRADLFAALLRQLGRERPVLLMIDDLHWADPSTRRLLGFLARTLRDARVLILLAYRSDALPRRHPALSFLAELARLPGVVRAKLGRLDRAETAQLVAQLSGGRPPEGLLDKVFRRSGGNPCVIEELVRAGLDQPMPECIWELLLERVGQLPGPARSVVRVAAVGGQWVPHALLAAVSGLPETELLEALRQAVGARVLATVGDSGYRFQHGLLREAVLRDLLPGELVRLHRIYAEQLTADPGLVPPERLAPEVGFHWYGAGDAVQAYGPLRKAAGTAQAMYAHAEQSQLLARALEVWQPGATDDRIQVWEQAVTAAIRAGEVRQAADLADRAIAESAGLAGGEAALLLALRSLASHELGCADTLATVEQAVKVAASAPPLVQARALDQLAVVLASRWRPEQAIELATRAAQLAAELGEAELEANARITAATARAGIGAYLDGVTRLQAARDLAAQRGDQVRLARAHNNLAYLLRLQGRLPEAVETGRSGIEVAARAGLCRTVAAVSALNVADALILMGRWDEADEMMSAALRHDPAPRLAGLIYAVRAEITLGRGDLARTSELLLLARTVLSGSGAAAAPESVPMLTVAAGTALAENRVSDARSAVTAGLSRIPECQDLAAVWQLLVTGARVHSTIRLRARVFTEPSEPGLAGALRAEAGRVPTDTPLLAAYAAWFAAESAGPGDAGRSWPELAGQFDALQATHPACYARVRAAAAAVGTGHRARARDLLREAAGAAERLGAAPLLEEIHRLAADAGMARDELVATPGDPPPDGRRLGLTGRELEVLRLMATGCSNREIAARLYISHRTAGVHVSHILAKLGVANRVEATAASYRLGLIAG